MNSTNTPPAGIAELLSYPNARVRIETSNFNAFIIVEKALTPSPPAPVRGSPIGRGENESNPCAD